MTLVEKHSGRLTVLKASLLTGLSGLALTTFSVVEHRPAGHLEQIDLGIMTGAFFILIMASLFGLHAYANLIEHGDDKYRANMIYHTRSCFWNLIGLIPGVLLTMYLV